MADSKLKIIAEGVVGAGAIALTALLSPLLRPFYRHWGATEAEVKRTLPGDEIVPRPKSELNCAITIRAPAEAVWPWFIQLGCQRGGWYSYDLLDNGGVPSADRIVPEYQRLEVGEIVKAVPNGSFGFPVAAIDPGRVLTLAGTINTQTGKPAEPGETRPDAFFSGDQTFAVNAIDGRSSRLFFRMRIDWNRSWINTLIYRGLLEPVSFVMSRKTLINVKRRAEALATKGMGD
jgi:hypothetical protein